DHVWVKRVKGISLHVTCHFPHHNIPATMSYHIKFLVALIALQATTSSSQQRTAEKTTRLSRMPLYYGKRSRPFPEWSHYGTNNLDMILLPPLSSSKIFPKVRRGLSMATYDDYLPEMKGWSQGINQLSHPIPGDFNFETALLYNSRHTTSDSGRKSRWEIPLIPFHVNNKKDEFDFNRRSFPRPPYLGNSNDPLLKSAIGYDLRDRPEPQETKDLKMISKLLGDEVFEHPFFISPDTHKLTEGGPPEQEGETHKLS
ncbi:unnamed protein product, partial [Lymnaea stagnalis]